MEAVRDMKGKPIPLLRDHIITLIIYVGLALITQSLFKTITVWPSAGAAIAAFLTFGLRIWPSIAKKLC